MLRRRITNHRCIAHVRSAYLACMYHLHLFNRLKELRLWSKNIRLISEAKEALESLKFADSVLANLSTSMKAAIANAQTVLEPFQDGK